MHRNPIARFAPDAFGEDYQKLSSSKTTKLVASYLNEEDATKKEELYKEAEGYLADTEAVRKAMIPRGFPNHEAGFQLNLKMQVPASISPKPVEYSIQIPKGYKPNKLWPLIIGLHGGGENIGSGDKQLPSFREVDQAIVVCPTSLDRTLGGFWCARKTRSCSST